MTAVPSPAAADAGQAWQRALAALYAMTRFDRPRRPVWGCQCCVAEKDARTLMEVAREEAPDDLMDRYGFKALTTWGVDARDLRWFLPRLIELLAVNPDRRADPAIIAGKAVMADFDFWPDEDRATLRGAFLALWRLWLEGGRPWRRPWRKPLDPGFGPDEILPGLAILGVDIAPLLDELVARARRDRALAEEYVDYAEFVVDYELGDAEDPDDLDPGGRAGPRYFLTEAAVAQLESLAIDYTDDDLGERLLAVADRLERHLVA